MVTLLSIWLAVAVSLMLLVRRSSAGLPLAYFMGLSLIHVPGAMLDLASVRSDWTQMGFEQTVVGMVSFLIAVMIARYRASLRHSHEDIDGRQQRLARQDTIALDQLALRYGMLGAVAYFLVMPYAGAIPSATAVVSSLGSLMMVGFCLRLWVARECQDSLKFWLTIAMLPALPLATLVQGGFLGFGAYWVLAVGCFLFAQSNRRLGYFLIAPAVVFVGMSVFVNYMASRDDIRSVVWSEQSGFGDRFERVGNVFSNFQWIDLSNSRHRAAIEDRLNQNWLVGAAMENLESGRVQYASGATLGQVVISLIPRALWPDKPAVGGGGTIVSDFTGMSFAEGTSVGAGQVLEFYINFGTAGVIGGYLLLGWAFSWIDLWLIESLYRGDQKRFLLWFLVGLALLQPGGNLVEIVVSTAASALTAYGMGYFFSRRSWPTGSTANASHGSSISHVRLDRQVF